MRKDEEDFFLQTLLNLFGEYKYPIMISKTGVCALGKRERYVHSLAKAERKACRNGGIIFVTDIEFKEGGRKLKKGNEVRIAYHTGNKYFSRIPNNSIEFIFKKMIELNIEVINKDYIYPDYTNIFNGCGLTINYHQ
jgi:hypothetical protein